MQLQLQDLDIASNEALPVYSALIASRIECLSFLAYLTYTKQLQIACYSKLD